MDCFREDRIQTSASVRAPGIASDHAFERDEPLAATWRGSHIETLHRGTVCVADPAGRVLLARGEIEQLVFLRSSAKPFQGMALVTTGAAHAFGLDDQDLAVACASHSGEPGHVEAVIALLAKAGVSAEYLQCGIHAPTNALASRNLFLSGRQPDPLHNNCSGKHAGMLAVCAHMGWPLETYLSPDHRLQVLNRSTVATFAGVEVRDVAIAIDGCGVPTFRISVRSIATAFARLASGQKVSDTLAQAASRIRSAMMATPFLVAGTSRFDTELMEAAQGAVVCKGGAAGVEGAGFIPQKLGFGLKMSDGVSSVIPAVFAATIASLGDDFGALTERIKRYRVVALSNHAGTEVGAIKSVA
jgi:L-asparaginase II